MYFIHILFQAKPFTEFFLDSLQQMSIKHIVNRRLQTYYQGEFLQAFVIILQAFVELSVNLEANRTCSLLEQAYKHPVEPNSFYGRYTRSKLTSGSTSGIHFVLQFSIVQYKTYRNSAIIDATIAVKVSTGRCGYVFYSY